ncbi:MAG: GNAT family N-acetyltransferase [Ardenticatenaceae bacterium]|nr:GNAT family N-acetyltransferase [Ardenticatenaceae bacterium]HBY96703.1 GNAT family N-acetyltransferase [Chloroflexota bacterium]
MSFEGRLVCLRARSLSDVEKFTEWFNDPEVTQFVGNAFPAISPERERELVEGWLDDPHAFSIETRGGQLIGNCHLFRVDLRQRTAELGIVIGDKAFWGQGYGTDAITLLLSYAFEHLGLHRVELHYLAFNRRAREAYEKCGFVEEGRRREAVFIRGQWVDSILMSILEREWREHHPAHPEQDDDKGAPATGGGVRQ